MCCKLRTSAFHAKVGIFMVLVTGLTFFMLNDFWVLFCLYNRDIPYLVAIVV